jgi:N-acetylmuramoyl-L-alanine amidase
MRLFHMAQTRSATIFALVAVLAAALAPAAAAPKAIAEAVAVEVEGEVTRFELSLDRDLEFSVFALADPYRVIIDLPEVEFRIAPDSGASGQGLVSAFRFGLFSAGKSRIVIDAAGPVAIAEPVIHKPADGRPARLVVELKATTRALFLRDFALNGLSRESAAPAPTMREAIIPPVAGAKARPVIVIDPGHGGVDPGAASRSGAMEKDLVLDFATDIAAKLRASGRFKVVLTRDTDVFLRLDRRRQIARESQADLFVSIHADSIRMSGVRGASVYTVSERASDEEAAALAAKENRADLIAGVPLADVPDEVSDILIDLARRETNKLSVDFAKELVKELRNSVKMNSNPHRSASFVVLKSPDVPSVLVELGYLSNQEDEDALKSEEWRTKAASSMANAVARYFATRLAENR